MTLRFARHMPRPGNATPHATPQTGPRECQRAHGRKADR
jgi:hypothetical protein